MAAFLFRSASVPDTGGDFLNLSRRVSSTDVASVCLHFHDLLIRHPIHIRVVGIVGRLLALGFFDSSLQQSFLLRLRLMSSCTSPHQLRHHLALLQSLLHLAHVHRHRNLRHHFCLWVGCATISIRPPTVAIIAAISLSHRPCRAKIIVTVLSPSTILVV